MGPSGNCTSLNILYCLIGQCWVGTLAPKTHTGRSSQSRCLSLQLTLPLGPPSHMHQPVWHSPVPFLPPSASHSGYPQAAVGNK